MDQKMEIDHHGDEHNKEPEISSTYLHNHDENGLDYGERSPNLAFDEPITGEDPAGSMEQAELGKKKKVPRRIIHFVDGDTLEEYSTDEEEAVSPPPPTVDPKFLDWLPWVWFWMVLVGTKSLAAADFLGEKLAWFFGITTPKYQYVIDEYHKMQEEDKEEARLELEEMDSQLLDVASGDQMQSTDGDKGLSASDIIPELAQQGSAAGIHDSARD